MRNDSLQLEDFNDAIKKGEPEDYNDKGPDHPLKNSKTTVAAEVRKELDDREDVEEEKKTIEDEEEFVNKMGTEYYITFAEFCKYLSIFNPKTGVDEKIACKIP